MNLYHLQYFLDACRLQSISKSAEKNHVSHSAVSQAIKSLENFLDTPLLVHSKRRFQLTTEGESFAREGQVLLQSIETTKENLRRRKKEATGELVIWAPQSLIVESLYEALSLYRKRHPKVEIVLKPGSAAQVRSAIGAEQGQIGIAIDDGYLDAFQSRHIRSGRFILISKSKAEIQDASLIVTAKDKVEVEYLRKKYRAKFKSELNISMEVMSWGVIRDLVAKKFGLGYVPDYCVSHELSSGKLTQVELPWPLYQYDIKAIWTRQRQLHPNAKLFLDLLISCDS
jgi:DNA-binding transcriptional LysR family regulator